MNILPSKTVSERRTFTANFGDELPWDPVITFVKIDVRVFSGVDPKPRDIFARIVTITGPEVVYQVKKGLPGVIYCITVSVTVGGVVYSKDYNLAVLTDQADTGGLFPVQQSVTSEPYPQIYKDAVVTTLVPLSGSSVTRIVFHANMQSGSYTAFLRPTGGQVRSITLTTYPVVEDSVAFLVPTGGSIEFPPRGFVYEKASAVLRPIDGSVTAVPKGFVDDTASATLIPTGGSLSIP